MKAIARSLVLIGVAAAGNLTLGTPQAKAQVSVSIGTGGYGAYPVAPAPVVVPPPVVVAPAPVVVRPYPYAARRPYYGGRYWGYGGYRGGYGYGYRGRYDRRDWHDHRGGYGGHWDDHRGGRGRHD